MLNEVFKCSALFLVALLLVSLKSSASGRADRAPDIQLLADAYGISYSLANRYQDAMVMLHEAHAEDVDDEINNMYDLLYRVIQANLDLHTTEKLFRQLLAQSAPRRRVAYTTESNRQLKLQMPEIERVLEQITYTNRFWRIFFEPYVEANEPNFCHRLKEVDLCDHLLNHLVVTYDEMANGYRRLLHAHRLIRKYPGGG